MEGQGWKLPLIERQLIVEVHSPNPLTDAQIEAFRPQLQTNFEAVMNSVRHMDELPTTLPPGVKLNIVIR